VFGDSYTTPDVCVAPADSFWGLLASHLAIDTIMNCSRPVNSFDSVNQLVIGMQEQINWSQDLVLIGIPPLERITIFDHYQNTEYLGYSVNAKTWHYEKFDIPCHRGLMSLQNYGTDRQLIIHHDRAWLETQTLRLIFLLTQWLDSINAHYMILNLSKNFDLDNRWGPSEFVLSYCQAHNRCILFRDTYHGINIGVNQPADSNKAEGHHGPAGNRYFFEQSLLPTMQRNGLC
jgi:hypothetical protein